MARIVPFTEARAELSELLDVVEREHEHLVITRKGKPAAVVMAVEEWESWAETIEILSDPDAMDALAASDADVAAGRLYTLDEVMKHLGRA
jgi:prevent-host-death family protein